MDVWLFQCLVWVSMMLNTSCGYRDLYDHEDYNVHKQREFSTRRSDLNTEDQGFDRQYFDNRPSDRSINTEVRQGYDRQYSDNRPSERSINSDVRTGYDREYSESRSSERSIPYDLNVQRVQDRRTDDDGRRNVNSTLKIVNNFPKPQSISTRRGVLGHQEPTKPSSAVVFPGPTWRSSAFEPQITNEQCLQTGICEDVPNYPQERVDELVDKLKASRYRFNIDKLVTMPEIAQRIGPNEEMLSLCRSRETIIAPKAVRDVSNKWYNVINGKNQVVQSFRVEICTPESAPCSDLIYVVSNAYNTTCVQKYQYRQMVVLNDDGNYAEKEFKVPSCCACAVYAVAQFGNR